MFECKICHKSFSTSGGLSTHIVKTEKLNIKDYYDKFLLNHQSDEGVCKSCNASTKFISINSGYSEYCSYKCSNSSDIVKSKKRETFKEHYGVDHYKMTEESKLRSIQVSREKYGVDFISQNDDIKKKVRETNLKKYGCSTSLLSPDVIAKTNETCIRKYGKPLRELYNQFKDKKNNTMLRKYGTIIPLHNEELKKKLKETCVKRYGVDNSLKSKIIIQKRKTTLKKKYGYEHILQVPEFKKKLSIKNLTRFFNKLNESSDRLYNRSIPLFSLDDYCGGNKKYLWKCKKCGKTFYDDLIFGNIPRCLDCYPLHSSISIMELELREFIKSKISEDLLVYNDRTVLNGKELDIYIPLKKLAIEFNGLYWHSEQYGKNETYHISKTLDCIKKDINLIQIFEDEWLNKQDIVKSILTNKLQLNTERYLARKCKILDLVDNEVIINFLNDNHMQGHLYSSINIGLYHNDELVSLLCIGKPRFDVSYQYEILRFCNKLNTTVVGGLSKLFSYFVNKYNPESIISYADLRYGIGHSYEKLGFEFIRRSKPSYFYYDKNGVKYTRFQFQKHLLKDKLEFYDEELTENQNMQLNGYYRLFDSGCNVYGFNQKKENT